MSGLVHDEQRIAWELRGAWAAYRIVRLTLSERCVTPVIIGRVTRVSVTGAFAVIDGWEIPCADIRGIGKPTVEDKDRYTADAAARRRLALAQDPDA